MGAKVTFDASTRTIVVHEVPTLVSGTLTVTLDVKEDIYSDAKDDWILTSSLAAFYMPVRAVGGDPLPGGKSLGTTYFLRSDWKIKPYEGSHRFVVNGNLYSEDGTSVFTPTTGSYNVFTESVVSNLVDSIQRELPEIIQLKYMIESQKETHQGFGTTFFVDHLNGDDLQDGDTPSTAVHTIAQAQNLAVSGRGDVIYVLASTSGTVTMPENIHITKEDIHIRGPGRGVSIQPLSGTACIIDANNCSVSGLVIRVASGSVGDDCLEVRGKFSELNKLYLVGSETGSGSCLVYRGGDYHEAHHMEVEKAGGDGVKFIDDGTSNGSPREITFIGGNFYLNGGHGFNLSATSANSTRLVRLDGCNITQNSGYGIYIGTNVSRTRISADTEIYLNTLGDLLDSGSYTADNRATASPSAVASAVRTELAPELTRINTYPLGLTTSQATMLLEMYNLLGLDPTKPLIVDTTTRTAGADITQSISEVGSTVTVTRIP